MNIKIRKLEANEIDSFIELVKVFGEVFEMDNFKMPGTPYLQKLLAKKGFGVFVAMTGEKVIAGLTTYVLDAYYIEGSYIYIYDLAVLLPYQRKGIGKNLIEYVLRYYQETPASDVFVQAELADGHAVDFYRSTGGTEQGVINFTYKLQNS